MECRRDSEGHIEPEFNGGINGGLERGWARGGGQHADPQTNTTVTHGNTVVCVWPPEQPASKLGEGFHCHPSQKDPLRRTRVDPSIPSVHRKEFIGLILYPI